jgi:hypothetical protein
MGSGSDVHEHCGGTGGRDRGCGAASRDWRAPVTADDRAVLRRVLDQLANALQTMVLIAEHLELSAGATAQDAKAITRQLNGLARLLHDARKGGA